MGDLGGETNEIFPGGSGIIGPDGEWVVGPVSGREEIVYGEIDLRKTVEGKLLLDTTGHYNRPDIFNLIIDDRPKPAIGWMSEGAKFRTIGTDDVPETLKVEASD